MLTCSRPGCSKAIAGNGLCQDHYIKPERIRRFRNMPKDAACSVEGCGGRDYSRGFCHKHYSSWRRYGDPTVSFRRRKGTGSININGYKILTINKVQILEHRWVMEQAIGRSLLPHEQVHHVNGNRLDNRLENLELWSTSQPPGQRVSDKVAWAREILTTYGQLFPEEGR